MCCMKGQVCLSLIFSTSYSLLEPEKVIGLVLLWRIELIKEQGREGKFFRL